MALGVAPASSSGVEMVTPRWNGTVVALGQERFDLVWSLRAGVGLEATDRLIV